MGAMAKLLGLGLLAVFAFGAVGKISVKPGPQPKVERVATAHEAMTLRSAKWARGCTRQAIAGSKKTALADLNYASAVLVANGEFYYGRTPDEIRATIALLPAYDASDGVSPSEAAALEILMKLGRQLSFAVAAEAIEKQREVVLVASSDAGISPDILAAVRPVC